jgi:anti-sigma regulatory factor (Ser/Thr protein kinase)
MREPSSSHAEPVLELRLRSDAPATAAGAALRAAAEAVGVGPDRSSRLRVLVEQLVTEARARERAAADGDVTVRVVEVGGGLHVEVADRRLPVTAAEARRLDSRRLVALGFADHLHTASHGEQGNVAEVSVRADAAPTADVGAEAVLDEAAPRVGDEIAAALEVRELHAADAEGLARCVYRCYGYSYLDPMLYRPELIRRAVRSRLLRSVVAVTPSGEVVGHIAMTFERAGDPVPEGGKLVVDPRYRGHHLAERLAEGRRAVAERLGLAGVWIECVTNHVFSQREVIASGGAETGFLIGVTPASVTMTGLADEAVGRHSLMTMFVPVRATPPCVVHVPQRYGDLVAGLAGRLGLERTVGTDGVRADGHTTLSTSVASDVGTAHLRLGRIGGDLIERVTQELEGLAPFDLAVVHLDVPIGGPAGAWAAESLERLGFCFGAWMPGFGPAGDVLRLQRVGSHPVDTAHVRCARPEGQEIRAAVLAEWERVRFR